MIEYIEGRIDSLNPAYVVIDIGGIGYLLNITLTGFSALEGRESARLLVHEVIREDAHTLYGFADPRERDFFRLLFGVSGVGATTARVILSAMSPAELEGVITRGEAARLKVVKGIGLKTAQRIIVDLRDKIKSPVTDDGELLLADNTASGGIFDEALQAVIVLGVPPAVAKKTLKKVFDAEPTVKLEDAIKKVLSMI